MLVTIDYREKELIDLCRLKLLDEIEPETEEGKEKKKEKIIEKIKLNVENLKLGDIIISHDDGGGNSGNSGNELLLFERKSLNDLAASIKDGRYAEQSFRLGGYESVPNHNIVYIIEGDLSKYGYTTKPFGWNDYVISTIYKCTNRVNIEVELPKREMIKVGNKYYPI